MTSFVAVATHPVVFSFIIVFLCVQIDQVLQRRYLHLKVLFILLQGQAVTGAPLSANIRYHICQESLRFNLFSRECTLPLTQDTALQSTLYPSRR